MTYNLDVSGIVALPNPAETAVPSPLDNIHIEEYETLALNPALTNDPRVVIYRTLQAVITQLNANTNFAREVEMVPPELMVAGVLKQMRLFPIITGLEQPDDGAPGAVFGDLSQPDDVVTWRIGNGQGYAAGDTAIGAALRPFDNRLKTAESQLSAIGDTADRFANIEATLPLKLAADGTAANSLLLGGENLGSLRRADLLVGPLPAASLPAVPATAITGVLDPARIPLSVRSQPKVASGDLTTLTAQQQNEIGEGSAVLLSDGRLLYYSGIGDKTNEVNYQEGPDTTPDISQVSGLQDALNALLSADPATLATTLDNYTDEQKETIRTALGVPEEVETVQEW